MLSLLLSCEEANNQSLHALRHRGLEGFCIFLCASRGVVLFPLSSAPSSSPHLAAATATYFATASATSRSFSFSLGKNWVFDVSLTVLEHTDPYYVSAKEDYLVPRV